MQLSIMDEETTLSRPITKQDISDFLSEYVSENTTELGESICKDIVINQLAVDGAVKIANDKQYSVGLIEKELKYTARKIIGVSMMLSFPLFVLDEEQI